MSDGKPNGKPVPVTPAQSLELLASALSYMMQCGLEVGAAQRLDGVVILIKGAQLVEGRIELCPVEEAAVPVIGTEG